MQINTYLHKCKYNYLIYNCYTNTNNKYLRYFNNKTALFFCSLELCCTFAARFKNSAGVCLCRYTLHLKRVSRVYSFVG